MILIPPKRICLSGGGIRGVAFVGALEELERHGLLRNVREYVGVSAGAFLGFVVCLGYTIQEIKKLCLEFDFSLLRSFDPENALEFLETYGVDTGSQLEKLLISLLKQKNLPSDLTFQKLSQLKPEGPMLRCYATDMNDCSPREFSITSTPDVMLITALMATMCLPFYFKPIEDPITGHLLLDGGVMNNYPMAFLTEEERRNTLGLCFSSHHYRKEGKIEDFENFLVKLYGCIFLPRIQAILEKTEHQTIILPNGDYPMWNFEADKEDRRKLIEAATEATKAFLQMNGGPRTIPIRRYSVS